MECMLTASQPHVDLDFAQPLAERSPTFAKTYLCDFAIMTKLSSRVIEGESPHHYHQCGDAVLQVGLCRQNADATVEVLREPLRFHRLVVLCSFRLESRHTQRSHRYRMTVQDAACAALQARAIAAAPKQTRVQQTASTRNQNKQHRRNKRKHRDREPHAVSKDTQPKDTNVKK